MISLCVVLVVKYKDMYSEYIRRFISDKITEKNIERKK